MLVSCSVSRMRKQLNLPAIRSARFVERAVDFERLRHGSAVKLFLSAPNVRSGKVKIVTDKEITADCVLKRAPLAGVTRINSK